MLDEGEKRPDQSIHVMSPFWAHLKTKERGDIELTQQSPLEDNLSQIWDSAPTPCDDN